MSEKEFLPASPVSVAITGKLSIPREEAARLINGSQNAQFVASVTYHTSYLVSALGDSQKVRKARKIGVEILNENQLFEYLRAGRFPPTKVHAYTHPAPPPFEVVWTEKYSECRHLLIKYRDALQRYTEREAYVYAVGQSPAGATYLSVQDDEGFKTFRADRIVEMVELAAPASGKTEQPPKIRNYPASEMPSMLTRTHEMVPSRMGTPFYRLGRWLTGIVGRRTRK